MNVIRCNNTSSVFDKHETYRSVSKNKYKVKEYGKIATPQGLHKWIVLCVLLIVNIDFSIKIYLMMGIN
jgi:hypothetical protein